MWVDVRTTYVIHPAYHTPLFMYLGLREEGGELVEPSFRNGGDPNFIRGRQVLAT